MLLAGLASVNSLGARVLAMHPGAGFLVGVPLAALGSVVVGLLESFSSFWASAFKEVIVFTPIIPVLVWLSLRSRHVEEEEQ